LSRRKNAQEPKGLPLVRQNGYLLVFAGMLHRFDVNILPLKDKHIVAC
jgi:hypothetical protein